MAIDLTKRWRINRTKYKKKHVPFLGIESKKGYEYPVYNYMYGEAEKIFKEIKDTYFENGFKKAEIIDLICDRTGMLRIDCERKLKGELSFGLWEFFAVLKALNFRFQIKSLIETKYSSSVERSTRGSWIIIKASGLIAFTMRINSNDYLDFDIDFSTEQRKSVKPAITKYCKEVEKALDWYFIKEAHKKTLPFSIIKWREVFRMKWYAKQFDFLHHATKKVITK